VSTMPLSDYEKRQLEAIEHQLAADSPRLSSELSSGRPVNLARRCLTRLACLSPLIAHPVLRVVVAILAGLGLVVGALRIGGAAGVPVGVFGYAVIVAALDAWVLRRRRRRGAE
jgi:Protein of unknown function (DUF3040).